MDTEECGHVCHCPCHDPNTRMLHFINCCVTCDECEERIRRDDTVVHRSQCHAAHTLEDDEQ